MEERRKSVYSEEDRILMKAVLDNLLNQKKTEQKIFGMSVGDFLKVSGVCLAVFAFYLRTNDAMDRLIKITDSLTTFVRNSDSYHSAASGVPFELGKPINQSAANTNNRGLVQ